MITKPRQRKKVLPEKLGGKKITQPNQSLGIKESLGIYRDKSMEEKAGAFYEQIGQPIPNFDMMDKIERMEALNEWREKTVELQDRISEINQKERKKAEEALINNQVNLKVNERQQQQQNSATGS